MYIVKRNNGGRHQFLTKESGYQFPENTEVSRLAIFRTKQDANVRASDDENCAFFGGGYWSVRFNADNLFTFEGFKSAKNVSQFLDIKARVDGIGFNEHANIMKQYEIIKSADFNHQLDYVEFIPSRKRTVLKMANTHDFMAVNYDGAEDDASYTLGFLYVMYKYLNNHLTQKQLMTKLRLVHAGLRQSQIRTYLEAVFIESGIVSPSKAIRILKEVKAHDKTKERVKVWIRKTT